MAGAGLQRGSLSVGLSSSLAPERERPLALQELRGPRRRGGDGDGPRLRYPPASSDPEPLPGPCGNPPGEPRGAASTGRSLGRRGLAPATTWAPAGVPARQEKAAWWDGVGTDRTLAGFRRSLLGAPMPSYVGCSSRRGVPSSVGRDLVASQFRGCTDLLEEVTIVTWASLD